MVSGQPFVVASRPDLYEGIYDTAVIPANKRQIDRHYTRNVHREKRQTS
jgi:hypothetical protein